MKVLSPDAWQEYELIDSGQFEKLERFGPYTLIRPEPQALWPRVLSAEEWNGMAHARFVREQKDKFRFTDDVQGGWKKTREMPDHWEIGYAHEGLKLTLRLALTGFGHVGVFPEQGENWNFVHEAIGGWKKASPKVLNLFAYTGAASVVARAAGAEVIHVDSSRPGLNWASQNMALNRLQDIRWVHEDALKFVRREARRGNRYEGIIMDPPPYGRGPKGEKWVLQEYLAELVELSARLLAPGESFFILNLYAAGISPIVASNIARTYFPEQPLEAGEFFLRSKHRNDLPMGTFVRFRS